MVQMGLVARKPVFEGLHPHSLIRAFVIHLVEIIISRLATSKISIYSIVSVAEQAGLNLTLSETPKIGFVAMRPK